MERQTTTIKRTKSFKTHDQKDLKFDILEGAMIATKSAKFDKNGQKKTLQISCALAYHVSKSTFLLKDFQELWFHI